MSDFDIVLFVGNVFGVLLNLVYFLFAVQKGWKWMSWMHLAVIVLCIAAVVTILTK